MFGDVTYAARSVYAHRDEMLYEHARKVAGANGTVLWADDIVRDDFALDEEILRENDSRRVVIVKEGAGTVQALLGKPWIVLCSNSRFTFISTNDF
jgi:hypothetical protein